ncbi:MAG: hypothetical protein PV344_06350, partial [Anaplasma sp.]|nr:hypothetical protein [Anaplasma sp.]
MKLFTGSNFRKSNVASVVLTYCPNCSRDLFFVNHRRLAKIRSSRKLGRFYSIHIRKYSVR